MLPFVLFNVFLGAVSLARGKRFRRRVVPWCIRLVVSIIVPLCGGRGDVTRALRYILGRACGSFRMVMISSNDGSGDTTVITRFASAQVRLVQRRGKNIDTTQGEKVRRTRKGCITFLSTSSM